MSSRGLGGLGFCWLGAGVSSHACETADWGAGPRAGAGQGVRVSG